MDENYKNDLLEQGFKIVGEARNGEKLEECIKNASIIDAVIVDANFSESSNVPESERDISGLEYARGLYLHKLNGEIPFFLFTARTDELLREVTKEKPKLLDIFPRHEKWFSKTLGESGEMFEAIKKEVDKRNSTSFKVRNRYQQELLYATVLGEDSYNYIFEVLCRDWDGTLEGMREPFATARKIIEQIFGQCEKEKIIPPISDNTTATGNYFFYKSYSAERDPKTNKWIPLYQMKEEIMPRPLAQSLVYLLDITQDAAHRKNLLPLKVDQYFNTSKDVLLLKSVLYILVDLIKWFVDTWKRHKDPDVNEIVLWEKLNK